MAGALGAVAGKGLFKGPSAPEGLQGQGGLMQAMSSSSLMQTPPPTTPPQMPDLLGQLMQQLNQQQVSQMRRV